MPKGLLNAYNERQKQPAAGDRSEPTARCRMSEATITVTQIKSAIGTKPKHRGTLRALGLGRIG